MAERTDSGRLFQRKGVQELKALALVLVAILGTNRLIPLFDLSERDGREVTSWITKMTIIICSWYCVARCCTMCTSFNCFCRTYTCNDVIHSLGPIMWGRVSVMATASDALSETSGFESGLCP